MKGKVAFCETRLHSWITATVQHAIQSCDSYTPRCIASLGEELRLASDARFCLPVWLVTP